MRHEISIACARAGSDDDGRSALPLCGCLPLLIVGPLDFWLQDPPAACVASGKMSAIMGNNKPRDTISARR